jgi:hypothetical protein
MQIVKVVNRDPNEVMEIVRALRQQGLQQGTDFDFAYHQTKYDPITGHHVEDRHAIFKFYVEKYATLFTLKYA